jgi:hypothetical protein
MIFQKCPHFRLCPARKFERSSVAVAETRPECVSKLCLQAHWSKPANLSIIICAKSWVPEWN